MKRVTPQDMGLEFDGPIPLRTETNFFVVHHIGAIPAGMTADDIDIRVVHRWHKERGFKGAGYNYLIKTDGTIQRGRKRDELGSHCKGYNHESIGICVAGDFTKAPPTDAQLQSLALLLADLHDHYGLDPEREQTILGHRDLGKTDCPGGHLYVRLPNIRKEVIRLCK